MDTQSRTMEMLYITAWQCISKLAYYYLVWYKTSQPKKKMSLVFKGHFSFSPRHSTHTDITSFICF